jgi:hypothetical protein
MSRSLTRIALMAPALALLAGCDVPSVPGISMPGPTLNGQVKGEAGSNLRIGLLGSKSAGQAKREIASSSVGSGGAYTLQLPNSPPLDLMTDANSSVAFTLSAYKDTNSNGKYDTTDEISDAAAQNGTFRFFVDDGPPGSYKSGWNLYKDGQYVQSFNTAFVLQSIL